MIHHEYMFREHSPLELVAWTRRLAYFRYMRAAGGLANDGDKLLASIRIRKDQTPSHILQSLGFDLTPDELSRINSIQQGFWLTLRQKKSIPQHLLADSIWMSAKRDVLEITIQVHATATKVLFSLSTVARPASQLRWLQRQQTYMPARMAPAG